VGVYVAGALVEEDVRYRGAWGAMVTNGGGRHYVSNLQLISIPHHPLHGVKGLLRPHVLMQAIAGGVHVRSGASYADYAGATIMVGHHHTHCLFGSADEDHVRSSHVSRSSV
jgi:hypothetical protein